MSAGANPGRDSRSQADGRIQAGRLQQQLQHWLLHAAYPLWAEAGVDRVAGGFVERLDTRGAPLAEPRRARVQARQAYAFAQAPVLGWEGDAARVIATGLPFFLHHYRRRDGLFRTLVAADGAALDEAALLYDQAFALLGFAAAGNAVGAQRVWWGEAEALFALLHRHLKRAGRGFDSGLPTRLPLLANPHMHLLEACLECSELGGGPQWRRVADDIALLALERLIDPANGVIRETYGEDWSPAPGLAGRRIEPGHLYEWAWLLLRWEAGTQPAARTAACRLIEVAERFGLHDGLVVDTLLDDFSVPEPSARLWPQAERLKAAALAAAVTGEPRYWSMVVPAGQAMLRYLQTGTAGLWHDRIAADGRCVIEPAPASSFYHIVAAILALTRSLQPRSDGESALPLTESRA
jgi:mannose-6-phosphate isomerase